MKNENPICVCGHPKSTHGNNGCFAPSCDCPVYVFQDETAEKYIMLQINPDGYEHIDD